METGEKACECFPGSFVPALIHVNVFSKTNYHFIR